VKIVWLFLKVEVGITDLVVDCNGSDVEFVDSDFVNVGGCDVFIICNVCVVGDEIMFVVSDWCVVVGMVTCGFVVGFVSETHI